MFRRSTPGNQDPCAPTKPHLTNRLMAAMCATLTVRRIQQNVYRSDSKEEYSHVFTESKQTTLLNHDEWNVKLVDVDIVILDLSSAVCMYVTILLDGYSYVLKLYNPN